MDSVGKRLQYLRKSMGMTQTELAKKLNLECAAVSKYETDRVPLTQESLIKLTEIFGVSADYLLGKTDIKQTINEPIEIAASMKDKADLSEMSDKDKAYILDLIERLKGKSE